ncbi:unnamed protein product [Allacma fusca]|uniref:WD repeat-containing protein 44 n=1 Tax=Allacma fusca TaxID=39272 RepID=A0A8J2KIC5_9HEXA|nr:unnamed protein product [Allacma fusca]
MSSTSSSVSSSSGSDSDEFFDAEEAAGTLLRFPRRPDNPQERIDLTTLSAAEADSTGSEIFFSPTLKVTTIQRSQVRSDGNGNDNSDVTDTPRRNTVTDVNESDQYVEAEDETRRRRMEEMRRRLNTEEIEEPPQDETSPSDSQTSSVEGVYGATSSSKISHPFKVVDHDAASLQSGVSIGRLGRIISNSVSSSTPAVQASQAPSNAGNPPTPAPAPVEAHAVQEERNKSSFVPEPDLVASCKDKNVVETEQPAAAAAFTGKVPVAPPRRKRKNIGGLQRPIDLASSFSLEAESDVSTSTRRTMRTGSTNSVSSLQSPQPPSPTVSIRSVSRDLDRTLDLTSQKFWVVKAQDEEKTRAKNSGPRVLRRTESLPKEMMEAFDPSGTGSLGGYSSHSNSNSSTLNNSQVTGTDGEVGVSQPAVVPVPAVIQISSLVSAMAAAEEKKEADLQMNLILRTRTDSGKLLSDLEILEQVTVLNLDTGERIPLSSAEEKIPKCMNPLSLHIMRLTSEYVDSTHRKDRDSDDESIDSKKSSAASQEDGDSGVVRKKTAQIRRFLGSTVKKTVDRAKSLAHNRHSKEDNDISTNEDILVGGQDPLVKMRASHSHKGPYDFDHLQQVQDLSGEHSGPVWCMKFSNCGRLLATAGQDRHIRIWVLKDHLPYFQDMRSKHTIDKVSPTPSQESIVSQHSHHSAEEMMQASENSDPRAPFVPRPLCIYVGHQADLLDIAWSKSFFLLSSSMDRTVRLWHISRRECLCCFQHIDFVTAIAFHPRDDRYFLSGSLDGKLRLWNIPDKKVALWNEVNGPNKLITTANFCQNGKFAVVGTYDGRCIFFHTEQLKYHTQIIVHRRKKVPGRKITGIEPMPGEDKILVTSNDSRIRLYDLRDLSLNCKYKGYVNSSSQIKGTFSHDGKYIVSGSENQSVYIWKTCHDYSKFSSARRDRNGFWEGVKAHNAVVTCAIFAPDPDVIVKQIEAREKELEPEQQSGDSSAKSSTAPKVPAGFVKSPTLTKTHTPSHAYTPTGYILVSADFAGCIKVFLSKVKPKHSSLPASALA